MPELRTDFHHDLEEIRDAIVRLGATVIDLIPRVTAVLLEQDLEGAEYVILMDEPCSALDPIATARIEDLMKEIKSRYTIVIVTHNMQQAARVSDRTAFFTTEVNDESDRRTGLLVEFNETSKVFSNPDDERTEQYVTGRFG